MERALRSRRIGLLAFVVVCGSLGASGTGLAQAAGILGLDPGEGSPGSSYEVAVTCAQEQTLYGRPLDDDPPATQVPLVVDQAGPSMWTAVAVAAQWDDVYGVVCGDENAQARFDSDAPRLYLGPLPENFMDANQAKTTIEGTDCPDGTMAQVTVSIGGEASTARASIDTYGDWSVPLPAAAAASGARIEASCGDYVYGPLLVAASSGPVEPPAPTVPLAPAGGAVAAEPQPGQATYTG